MLIRLIFIILFFGSAGCSPNLPFLSQQAKPQKSSKEAVVPSIDKIHTKETKSEKLEIDPRLAKILKSPSLIANKKNIEAAQKTVLIVKSQTEPVVTAISNIGPKLDNDDLDLDATGGLSITKLISDGGVVRAMSNSAELNVRASELLYAQNINSQLMEVVKAEQAIINFGKIEAIYNEQLAVYNDNLPLIQTAAKANIISKTDVLKLEQLKLKSEESYLTAKTGADAAQLIRKKYNLNNNDNYFTIDLKKWKSVDGKLAKNNFINIQLIETQIHILEKDIEAIESQYLANVALAGTATANVTDIDNSLGFVGLNISLPVKDGGKKNFQIQEKKMQIEALKQQKADISLLKKTSYKAIQNFQKIYELRSKLLSSQIENSKVISEDIELKLRAGAASVIDLATEKMNFYDLRSQGIALEYQNINEIINFYQDIGYQCDLTELCDQINLVTISNR
mgnify:FL=1